MSLFLRIASGDDPFLFASLGRGDHLQLQLRHRRGREPADTMPMRSKGVQGLPQLRRSGPNLEPRTVRVTSLTVREHDFNIGRKVGPCPGTRGRWV